MKETDADRIARGVATILIEVEEVQRQQRAMQAAIEEIGGQIAILTEKAKEAANEHRD